MDVVASFEYSTELELCLKKLEGMGVEKHHIVAIPLDENEEKPQLFDTTHHSDGVSLMDLGLIIGCIFMLLGSIYGFILDWGPIIWGLIGLVAGIGLGIIIKIIFIRKQSKKKKWTSGRSTEVFITIRCTEKQIEKVRDILFKHRALGVGILDVKTVD
ncbi:hypothetical protein [Aquibacillus albus]|uniref:Magnesium transporter n=1 Tax=Aquibacillus albus TaxID=1168171 RepID=A0ABS2N5I0_9BACI|nr:hypothetical protein [Aquibacillus albus]MBM7573412.1 hypothetical protein [Aquibacillus albus]